MIPQAVVGGDELRAKGSGLFTAARNVRRHPTVDGLFDSILVFNTHNLFFPFISL